MNNFFYHPEIALRNLRRDGLYSAINIGESAGGITAFTVMRRNCAGIAYRRVPSRESGNGQSGKKNRKKTVRL